MKVLCVGRNYAKHARELGNAPGEPVWFLKPDSAIIADGAAIELPAALGRVDHEVELAVRIGREARRVTADGALRHVDAITVANDVTARDLQEAAKKAGQPWTLAKARDTFLPLGAWQAWSAGHDPDLQGLRLRLAIGGQVRQEAPTSEMTWDVASLLARASQWTTLRPGDVVLTGTPEGVGPMRPGETVVCELLGAAGQAPLARLSNPVVAT